MTIRIHKKIAWSLFILFSASSGIAQNNIGMATGNYAGISGVWLNPANAVDSRYKFDINIIGLNSYFDNNYLLVKNSAFLRRLFDKEPYKSSLAEVKKDLLREGTPAGKVYARTENKIQFPLSFLLSIGKKSAIAITMANRTVNRIDSLNPLTAQLFFDKFREPSLFNTPMNNDGFRYNFLNWQEAGFTYGRVLIGKGAIFLKGAVTTKWIGAGAAGFIQTERATVSFKDSNTLSLASPLMRYGRTTTADFGEFQRKNIFNNIEDQSLGFDMGFVFELRANIKKFKYEDEDEKTLLRRDKNKYLFRLGLSVVDIGEFGFSRKPLTFDHSANILNWNFSQVKAKNFSDFDTAYTKLVAATPNGKADFTYRLPAAAIMNFDLHLFGPLYINTLIKRPLSGYGDKADAYLEADRWTVITPRFETKFLGIYVPVSRVNGRTNIGATVKFGPLYLGSNNLAQVLSNDKNYEADFHAGLRLSILHGKPSKIQQKAKRLIDPDADDIAPVSEKEKRLYQRQTDSLRQEIDLVKRKIPDSTLRPVINVIIQNGYDLQTTNITRPDNNNIIIKNESKGKVSGDADTTTGFLLRELAATRVQLRKMQEQIDNKAPKTSEPKGKKAKSEKEKQADIQELENELNNLKTQMALQNATLITIAAANAAANQTKTKPDSATKISPIERNKIEADSNAKMPATVPIASAIQRDTVMLRDTVMMEKIIEASSLPVYQPVYFELGKSILTAESKTQLRIIANDLNEHSGWKLELTGRTDPSGSATTNQKVAKARINAVKYFLMEEGIAADRIFTSIALSTLTEKIVAGQRRVDILLLAR